MAKKEKEFNAAGDGEVKGWYNGRDKRIIPFKDMSDEYLAIAHQTAQKKELYYDNRADVFSRLQKELEQEADRRKIILNETHKNHKKMDVQIVETRKGD